MFIDCLLYVNVLPAVSFNLHNTLHGSHHYCSFTDEETEAQRAEGMTQCHTESNIRSYLFH